MDGRDSKMFCSGCAKELTDEEISSGKCECGYIPLESILDTIHPIAWCCYRDVGEQITINTCDSDAPRAFEGYPAHTVKQAYVAGRSYQAIIDLQARDRFTCELTKKHQSLHGELFFAESILTKLSMKMQVEYKENGEKWPRDWMEKHTIERDILIKARRILLARAIRLN